MQDQSIARTTTRRIPLDETTPPAETAVSPDRTPRQSEARRSIGVAEIAPQTRWPRVFPGL